MKRIAWSIAAALSVTLLFACATASRPDPRESKTAAAKGDASEKDKLVGDWRLLSFKWTVLATGDAVDAYGKAPKGFLTYGRDGRMLALIVQEGRPKPADVSKVTAEESLKLVTSMIAYGGTYDFDGQRVTHHVDMSANETWTGTDLVRIVKFEGNRVTLSTLPMLAPDGSRGVAVLTFERND